jgi:hypothetical protein
MQQNYTLFDSAFGQVTIYILAAICVLGMIYNLVGWYRDKDKPDDERERLE